VIKQDDYIRSGVGIINTNVDAYNLAKERRKKENYMQSLERRINKLEAAVENLENTLNECKREKE